MFKRGNYSKRALSTFEIVGSFIVDLYYNHFYQEAKRIRIEGRVDSVTDGYKHAIKAYLNSFQNPDSYRKTIVGIHKYYYTTTRFGSISFSECVNEIVKHFIPEDFFDSTTNQQRDGILRMVLLNSVKKFSSDVLCSNLLDTLIDNHGESSIVRQMQDKMVQALMFEREKMFQNIFNVSNNPKDGGDFTIVMKMKTEMVKLVKENHTLSSKYGRLKSKAMELLDIVKVQKEKLEELQEPDNFKLEHSEREHDQYRDENRHMQYDEHHPEKNFERYREDQNRSTSEGEYPALCIPGNQQQPNGKKYPYRRPPRTDSSYRPEPPPDNVTRFAPYPMETPMTYISTAMGETNSTVTTSVNKYGPPPTGEPEHTREPPGTITSHVTDATDVTDVTDVAIGDGTGTKKEQDPVESMSPATGDFFSSNMLDIN
jgi:hypothetical protein